LTEPRRFQAEPHFWAGTAAAVTDSAETAVQAEPIVPAESSAQAELIAQRYYSVLYWRYSREIAP